MFKPCDYVVFHRLSGTHGLEGAYGQVIGISHGKPVVKLLADEDIEVRVNPAKLRRACAFFTEQFKNFPAELQKQCGVALRQDCRFWGPVIPYLRRERLDVIGNCGIVFNRDFVGFPVSLCFICFPSTLENRTINDPILHQRLNGTESQRTPKEVTRAIRYSGSGVRSMGPVGDFLEIQQIVFFSGMS